MLPREDSSHEIMTFITGSIRPISACLSAAWTARRAADDMAAGEDSVPKRDVDGSNLRCTWVSCKGNARRGPRASAAVVPLTSAVRKVGSVKYSGSVGVPSLVVPRLGGISMVVEFPACVTLYIDDEAVYDEIGNTAASQLALPFLPAISLSKTTD